MLVILALYAACFAILWWGYFGYHIFLGLMSIINPQNPPSKTEIDKKDLVSLSILVPCYNEEAIIRDKVKNLAQLDYPPDKLSVFFLDGCSSDATVRVIREAIQDYAHMHLIETGVRGKIPQLNSALPILESELIVNTDVDGFLEPDVLLGLVELFLADPQVGVVGALVVPRDCSPEEEQYWKTQNQTRALESQAYSSSIVIAGCYAFRRGIIDRFPDDVIADDIFVAFEASIQGHKVLYSDRAVVFDTRSPRTTEELVRHKFRKTNAYITELLRFLHCLPRLDVFWRVIFLTRVLQVIAQSWLLILFGLLTISLLSLGQIEIVLWCAVVGVVSLWLAHRSIARIRLPHTPTSDNVLLGVRMFLLTSFLLVLASLTYPLYHQTSSYDRCVSVVRRPSQDAESDQAHSS
jgi:cellulose synthase/poly-beta-1,6-N-acetylglucosamine synthase-like glycosyltransferase